MSRDNANSTWKNVPNTSGGNEREVSVPSCVVAGCPNTPTGKTIIVSVKITGDATVERTADICDDCLNTLSEPPKALSFGFHDPRHIEAQ